MKVSRALVIANPGKPLAGMVKKQVESFLRERGIAISTARPQLVVTVGGDGTVLFSKEYYGIPFFAIGSSTSFICQAKFSDWHHRLPAAIRGLRVEKRLMLQPSLNGRKLPPVLNEIGIRNPEPRVLSIHLQSGLRHFAFRADGLLLSTPTGSPAYAYSCGGKEMGRAGMHAYQAVAISPFRRLFAPTFIPAGTTATIRISGSERAQLFMDGQHFGAFTQKDTLRVRGGKRPFLFLKA